MRLSSHDALRLAVGYRILWSVGTLVLLAMTWRLWTPADVFPRVPLLSAARQVPPQVEYVAAAALATALALFACSNLFCLLAPSRSVRRCGAPRIRRFACLTVAVSLLLLWVSNQHRLQPWAYHAFLIATATAFAPSAAEQLRLFRLLAISIYAYSAIGKFDFQFLHTVGNQLVDATFQSVAIDAAAVPAATKTRLAMGFPCGELMVAFLLAVPRPRWRVVGSILAAVCHGYLIVLLGPWGLGHQPGVIVWNVMFLLQVILLFLLPSIRPAVVVTESTASSPPPRLGGRSVSVSVVALAIVLPLFEPLGWWDHWLSWGLYSPRNSRAIVEVRPAAIGRLPESVQDLIPSETDPGVIWVRVPTDAWSLETLAAPIYPHSRFQIGVAIALAESSGIDDELRVTELAMAKRLSGEREMAEHRGLQQIRAAARRYRINALPSNDPPMRMKSAE